MLSMTVAELCNRLAKTDESSLLKRTMRKILEDSFQGRTALVLEYPDTPADDLGRVFILSQLEALGFTVEDGYSEARITWGD
jgi:hypothetical protein